MKKLKKKLFFFTQAAQTAIDQFLVSGNFRGNQFGVELLVINKSFFVILYLKLDILGVTNEIYCPTIE
jgi:hypothetical protein